MRLRAVLGLALLGSLLAGCGKNAPAPATPTPAAAEAHDVGTGGGRTQIAMIPGDPYSFHDQTLHAGAAKAIGETKKGPDGRPVIDLLWQLPERADRDAALTADDQVHLAQKCAADGIAAIIIVPRNAQALAGVVAAAAPNRIPVIAVDASFNTDACKSAVASDDREAAKLASAAGGKAKIIGPADDPQKILPALQSGELSALILPDPLAEGYQSVKTAIDCIKEKKVARNIIIPPHALTRENLADPAIAALLHPPIAQYLPEEAPSPK